MDTPSVDQIRASRRYGAPIERVFDAWLDPVNVSRWLFATPGGETVRCEIDPSVGGRFSIVVRRDGDDVEHVGRYLEITRPFRLVFTFAVPKFSPQETRVTVDFTGNIDGCTVTLTHDGVLSEWAERTRQGWAMILENLAQVL
jgi:uncharacterized protein YndB with AHSA1/START domain